MNSNGFSGLDISARSIYVVAALALMGIAALVGFLVRGIFFLMEHVRWVP